MDPAIRKGSESMDPAMHLDPAIRMESESMDPATHLNMDSAELDAAMRMNPAELGQMIIDKTY